MSKSVEELFRNAPEGTTHWDASKYRVNSFMKLEGDTWFYWPPASLDPIWNEFGSSGDQDVSCMIPRPQPNLWSGPQDGLPPVEWCAVGKMVQVMSMPTHHHEDVSIYLSKPSKIVATYTDDDGDTFLMLRIDCDFGTGYECFAAHRVLPAKTEKQIAAEQRETAIADMAKVLPGAKHECWTCNPDGSVKPYENTYEILGLLVDAGFKREVV